jgi:hypothetical protein
MGFLNKLGIGVSIGTPRVSAPPVSTNGRGSARGGGVRAPLPAVGATRMPESQSVRISNGLKEFLWNLDGLGRGTLLDMGAAWQTTLSFFIERGFRVTSDDLLRSWKDFLDAEQIELQKTDRFEDNVDRTPAGRALRFLKSNLEYPNASFDAVLLWDLLDYLEPAVATQVVATMTEMLRPGGVVLAMFHNKKPEGFQRYRVVDSNTLQVIVTPVLCQSVRVYQNREIQDLFGRYRTMKSFVGRDQLREALFIK